MEYAIAVIVLLVLLPWTCALGAGVGFLIGGVIDAAVGTIVGLAMAL